MKNFVVKYLSTLFLGAVISLAAVFSVAHADNSPTVLADLTTPTSLEDTTTTAQRVAQRKASSKLQLTAAEKLNLASKCSLAQSALTDVRTKDRKAATIRLQAYSDLSKKLAFLVDNLSAQGVDASQLLAAQNKFVGGINTYLKDAEAYKTAVDDAIDMDCKADPEGFKASLNEARQLRATLSTEVNSIKDNLPAIRATLSDERQLLIKTPAVKPVVRSGVKK
jgi:hypothetical protein